MQIKAGIVLTDTSSLDDPNFDKVTIFITEYNEKGATGFVVNKLFGRTLNELEEFKDSLPFPLYDGGPMDREHLFFIHRRPDIIRGGTPVTDTIYFGGNFQQAVAHVNDRSVLQHEIKIFVGYCGWDFNQLEDEVEEGSWIVGNADIEKIF
ncbi:YqgE/AlgH family protein [Ferruginibacter paludis]|uniref:YqgE/AlgH family protein n=1 Tax=Ferruginibacter paludis TaxID=1310417 RepID=UPI0025B44465|nr:YqgE/AlgH family protein [Ferruginibacter paludis]MDN3654528.1 YqgE/AlgH family protein [Ferruginibacter paludis]